MLSELNKLLSQVSSFSPKSAVKKADEEINKIRKDGVPEKEANAVREISQKIMQAAIDRAGASNAKTPAQANPFQTTTQKPSSLKTKALNVITFLPKKGFEAVKAGKEAISNNKLVTAGFLFTGAVVAGVKATSAYLCQPEVIKGFFYNTTKEPSEFCSVVNMVSDHLTPAVTVIGLGALTVFGAKKIGERFFFSQKKVSIENTSSKKETTKTVSKSKEEPTDKISKTKPKKTSFFNLFGKKKQ